jgi:hypothetical protein
VATVADLLTWGSVGLALTSFISMWAALASRTTLAAWLLLLSQVPFCAYDYVTRQYGFIPLGVAYALMATERITRGRRTNVQSDV